MRFFKFFLLSTILFGATLTSCIPDEIESDVIQESNSNTDTDTVADITTLDMEELEIPSGFEFETDRAVQLNISDAQNQVRYTIKVGDKEIHNGFVINNNLTAKLKLADATYQVVLIRNSGNITEEFSLPVSGNQLSFTYN